MSSLVDHQFLVSVCASSVQGEILNETRNSFELISDWPTVLAKAVGHGIVPTTYQILSSMLDEADPRLHLFRDEFLRNSAQSLKTAGETANLYTELEQAKINALFYKGLTTSQQIYGNLLGRPAGDIDFLVPRDCARKTLQLLKSRGYRAIHPDPLSDVQELALIRFCEGRQLVCRNLKVNADLHWNLLDRWSDVTISFEELWDRHSLVNIGPREVPALSLEYLALLLCLHGTQHGFRRLKWVLDIARITRDSKVNWSKVAKYAAHRSPVLIYATSIAHHLLGSPKIFKTQEELKKLSFQKTLHLRKDKTPKWSFLDEDIQTSIHPLLSSKKGIHRYSQLLKIFFRPTVDEISSYRIPRKLHWLYHVIRCATLTKKFLLRQAKTWSTRKRAPARDVAL